MELRMVVKNSIHRQIKLPRFVNVQRPKLHTIVGNGKNRVLLPALAGTAPTTVPPRLPVPFLLSTGTLLTCLLRLIPSAYLISLLPSILSFHFLFHSSVYHTLFLIVLVMGSMDGLNLAGPCAGGVVLHYYCPVN